MNVGDTVRVLAPFNETYPDTYQITDIVIYEDVPPAYLLGDIGGFDGMYLEAVK